jgi:hypothetical protein
MTSTWDSIAQEHLARKMNEAQCALDVRPPTPEELLNATLVRHAEQAEREEALDRLHTWLHDGVLPASANSLFRLTLAEAIFSELPWVRLSFAMQQIVDGGSAVESTLTFTVPDGMLLCTPHLLPVRSSPTTLDDVYPTDELPDATDLSVVDETWVVEVVQQFVRAALARQ